MIRRDPRTPEVVETDHGYFSILEFEHDIWVMNIRSNRKGNGNRLLRELVGYAKEKGKNLHGLANRQGEGMSRERLMRWYKRIGAVFREDTNIVTLRIE